MGSIKLIVNADDFGQSEGINEGIIRAFEQGIVTSASLMVRYPSAINAAKYANENHMDLGLHVDLGEWIFTDGNWEAVYEVVSQENVELVEDEINRQLKAFIDIVGKPPTHIDSHQHVHMQESINPLFLEIARKLNVTLRRCSQHVSYCGDFYGQNSDTSPSHDSISTANLSRIITTLPDGISELACHPGINVEIETMYKVEREKEVNSLCDKRVREMIVNTNIELYSFSEIPF